MKRLFDGTLAFVALVCLLPVLAALALFVWLEDGQSPWYGGIRVGRGGCLFRMWKFRSMHVGAWKTGVNSTANGDTRLTRVGQYLRRSKLDELPQLWNVLCGQMSFVGPRPQVLAETELYTDEEWKMLVVRPGITDLASIVFSDEGDILAGSDNPDLLYNQVIRPWKSRIALLYVRKTSFFLDLKILSVTLLSIVSRSRALSAVQTILRAWQAEPMLCRIASRQEPPQPYPPPGAKDVVSVYPGLQEATTNA